MNTYSGAALTTKINAFLERKGARVHEQDSSDSGIIKEGRQPALFARITSLFESSNSTQVRG